jgi:hypothetical protein
MPTHQHNILEQSRNTFQPMYNSSTVQLNPWWTSFEDIEACDVHLHLMECHKQGHQRNNEGNPDMGSNPNPISRLNSNKQMDVHFMIQGRQETQWLV